MTSSNRCCYTKRPGTGGQHGQQYEVRMACVMLLRAVRSGKRFHLATNMKGAGAFDDIVLRLHSNDGPSRTLFMQLKHKLNTEKVVPRSALLALTSKSDLGLLKYFLSFRDEILPQLTTEDTAQVLGRNLDEVSLVLYTNASAQFETDMLADQDELLSTSCDGLIFSFKNNMDEDVLTLVQHIELYKTFLEQLLDKLYDDENQSTIIQEEVSNFMEHYKEQYPVNERKGNINIYQRANKLRNEPSSQQIAYDLKRLLDLGDLSNYETFLQNTKLCTRQAKESDLDCVIQEEFKKLFGMCREQCASLVPKLLTKVQQWWAAEDGTHLTEESSLWLETIHDALLITNEGSIREIGTLGIRFNEDDDGQLRTTLAAGRMVLCLVQPHCTKVGMCKVVQSLENMQVRYLLGSNESALRFWKTRWCNLLVVEFQNDSNEIFPTINDILLQQPENRLIIVAHESELHIILENNNFTLHKYVELKLNINFGGVDEDTMKKVMTRNILFQGHRISLGKLIRGHQEILEKIESELFMKILKDVPIKLGKRLENLLPHYIPRTLQRANLVRPDLMRDPMQEQGRVFALGTVGDEELPSSDQVVRFNGFLTPGCRFYMVDNTDLMSIQEQSGDYVCISKEDDSFHAQTWNGDIDINLFGDHGKMRSLSPDTLCDLPGRVAVIAAEPGMGKSTLTTCMALRTKLKEPSTWVVRINLSRMTSYLDTVVPTELTKDYAINFLAEGAGVTGLFEKDLFQYCVNVTGSIVVFFDGFDEICPDYKDQVLMLFRYLLETNIRRIWITSRLNWRHILEQSMISIAFTVEEFSSNDQRRFLENVWSERVRDVDKQHLQNFISDVLHLFTDSLNDIDRSFLGVPLQTMIVAEVFEQYLKEGFGPKYMDVVQLYEELFKKKCQVYFEQKRGDNVTHPVVKNKINIELKFIEDMHICSAMVLYMSSKDISTLHDKSFYIKGTTYLKEDSSDWLAIGIIHSGSHGNPEFIHRTVMEFFVSKWIVVNYHTNSIFLREKCFSDSYFVVRRMLNIMLTEGFPLHTATLNYDVDYLKQNLNIHNVNSTDKGNRTLLHVALAGNGSHTNFRETVQILLSYSADIDAVDSVLQWSTIQYADYSGNWVALGMILQEREIIPELDYIKPRMKPALLTACREGYVELVQYLITEGVDVNVGLASLGRRPLHVAAQHGQVKVMKCLLQAGACVNAQDGRDYTALHMASESGYTNSLDCLLLAGADINAAGLLNMTALHLAVRNGHIEVVKALLTKGSETDAEDVFGNTPLDLANVNCHHDIINCLEKVDPCVELKGSSLDSAVRRGDLDSVKMLTTCDTSHPTEEGKRTPLHIAAGLGNLDIARFLIENGSAVTALDESGMNPLHLAVIMDHSNMVRLLIDNRSSVHCSVNGMQPVHLAVNLGHLDIVRLLVERGCSVDARDSDNWTPLHYAVKEGHLNVVQVLLENGSNVNALNDKNKTPLHYSAKEGLFDVSRLLIGFGSVTDSLDYNHRSPLHCAAKKGHLEITRLLIDKGSTVNARDKANITALHCASDAGHLDIARLLIEKGAAVNSTDVANRSALHYAAKTGHFETVRLLVEKGSDVCGRDKVSKVPFHYASAMGHLDVTLLLIEMGTSVNATDTEMRTGLHFAADQGHLETVRLLIDKGSAVYARDKNNKTALHCAAAKGYLDVARLLIRKGAAVNATDVDNRIGLHLAADQGYLETVRLLIEKGSVVDAPDKHKKTPLHCASAKGHLDVARLLIGKGAVLSVTDMENKTGLHFAVDKGHLDTVRFLIDKGSVLDAEDKDNRTSLHCASAKGYLDIARLLIGKGADVNVTDAQNRSCLHFAADCGHLTTVRFLIEKRSSAVNARDHQNITPLHCASAKGHLKTARLLIGRGADVCATDVQQRTALHYAAMEGHVETVRLLINNGSSVDVRSKDHSTPLHYAACQGRLQVVDLLVEYGCPVDALDRGYLTPLDLARHFNHQDVVNLLADKISKI